MGMVCVAQELRCECIVRDCTKDVAKFEVTLPSSTPVQELITRVAEKMNYEPNSFQLTMQTPEAEIKILTENTGGSLESAGLGPRNSFILEGISGNSKNLVVKSTNSEGTNISSPPAPPEPMPSYQIPSLRPTTASPATEYTFSTPLIRHETGYVGLVNQAMTCYLNSLLQALYMTPEFRNALYKWQFDGHQNPTKCIPFQLQKLFLNLQTSSKTAVETTELTRSFGWESGEVWQQHDIQELCRVMFDALEQEFKDTEQSDLINQLYQGKMTDYVKCLECGTEKSRVDTFLDIPLPVRPFGSTVAYGSVEEALKAFVSPETLEGNNQYKCDKCGKKCDAHKGLKFTKFPYLLTLHLKRFDFDYNTLHRIKLNDKLVFPEVLDLNSFVASNTNNEDELHEANHDDVSMDADSVLDEETNQSTDPQIIEVDQEEDEGIDLSSNSGNNHENEKNKQQFLNTGPYWYELYSIMIHSGSATGGHYYAYIKDFAKGEWFCFNDQSVTSITHEDIKKTYGGSGGSSRSYYSGAYSSSTNAYMLMYRQINKELNCYAMVEEEFPPHIKKLLIELKEAEEKEKAFRAKQEEMMKIKVHANHPMLGQPRSSKMFCHNDNTIEEVKALAYSSLKLEDVVPEDRCRLVSYNKSQEEIEESLDGREKETISEVFSNLRCTNYELLLEIRDKDKKFLPYNIGDIRLTVYIYDGEKQAVEGPHEIRTSPCQTLQDLKKLLQEYIPLKTDNIHLVLVKTSILHYISNNNDPLNKLGFSSANTNKVFICYKGTEGDLSETFQTSEMYKILDEVKNVITLQISLPDTKKDTLELLLIPPLEGDEEEKPSDSTPTGEGLPLTNGLQEEELGYSSGAGGTSDQSTSEDSSLTDSDRTIIGEVVNDCPLSSPSDPDQQLLSLDNHATVKSTQINGEIEKWENDTVNPNLYFMATPYEADGGQKMLRVVVDRSIDIPTFKKRLEKYIGVEHKFIKLLKGPDGQEIAASLRQCKDDERICVKLERVLSEGEHRIRVNHLDLSNSSAPDRYICDWIVPNGYSIATLKKELLREVDKRAGLKIPYERCRLRKQNWKNPGAVLLDNDVWDEIFRSSPRIEVYVQELSGPDPVTQSSQVIIFVRRWHPSTMTLGPFEEIVTGENSVPCSLSKKLTEISGIPIEHLKLAKSKLQFPGETVLNIGDLCWEFETESKYGMTDWEREDGAIIFYRDDREEIKSPSKDEQQEANSQETNSTSNTSSYISGYSPRKERALKIYLNTTPRRSRSVVDVD